MYNGVVAYYAIARTLLQELLTVLEAARVSRRNPETVRRWVWHGKLRARKLGNQLFIERLDLEALLSGTAARGAANDDFLRQARALRERIRSRRGDFPDVTELLEETRTGRLA